MIAIMGHSGSGKDTVLDMLVDMGFEKIVSYTTRPPRYYEKDGDAYHFIDKNRFLRLRNEGFFAETTKYRGWYYGIAQQDCKQAKVAIIEPNGLEQLRQYTNDIFVVYIQSTEETRRERLHKRGDDAKEIERRIKADRELFASIESVADYTISNDINDIELLRFTVSLFVSGYALLKLVKVKGRAVYGKGN